jgi:hypothetical protein
MENFCFFGLFIGLVVRLSNPDLSGFRLMVIMHHSCLQGVV